MGAAAGRRDPGLGLPLYLFGGRLLFGRERGSCFVWLPKPEGEERCVGEEGKGLLQRLSPQ